MITCAAELLSSALPRALFLFTSCDRFPRLIPVSPELEASSEESPPADQGPAASTASEPEEEEAEATENGEKAEGAAEQEKGEATGKKE